MEIETWKNYLSCVYAKTSRTPGERERERERERESGLRYKEADETKALSYESGATKTAQLDAQYGP